jgi:hypothetical protein
MTRSCLCRASQCDAGSGRAPGDGRSEDERLRPPDAGTIAAVRADGRGQPARSDRPSEAAQLRGGRDSLSHRRSGRQHDGSADRNGAHFDADREGKGSHPRRFASRGAVRRNRHAGREAALGKRNRADQMRTAGAGAAQCHSVPGKASGRMPATDGVAVRANSPLRRANGRPRLFRAADPPRQIVSELRVGKGRQGDALLAVANRVGRNGRRDPRERQSLPARLAPARPGQAAGRLDRYSQYREASRGSRAGRNRQANTCMAGASPAKCTSFARRSPRSPARHRCTWSPARSACRCARAHRPP